MFHLNSAECTDRRQESDHKFRLEPVCWLWGIPPPLPLPAWSGGHRRSSPCFLPRRPHFLGVQSARAKNSIIAVSVYHRMSRVSSETPQPAGSAISYLRFGSFFQETRDLSLDTCNSSASWSKLPLSPVFILAGCTKQNWEGLQSVRAEVLADWNNPNQPGRLLARGNTRRNANPSFENH